MKLLFSKLVMGLSYMLLKRKYALEEPMLGADIKKVWLYSVIAYDGFFLDTFSVSEDIIK